MATWIWKFGEFEIYHNMLLHNRRTLQGKGYPAVWKVYPPETSVRFFGDVESKGGKMYVHTSGQFTVTLEYADGGYGFYVGNEVIDMKAGKVKVVVTVSAPDTFPCLYLHGAVETDGSWTASDLAERPMQVGTSSLFQTPEQTPVVFPFSYESISYTKKENVENGVLFDFGKETFAKTWFTFPQMGDYVISFGESREEALDPNNATLCYHESVQDGSVAYGTQAFRYIFVNCLEAEVRAEYEYLPLAYRGAFSCDEELINRVWDIAAYTFHLNTREFLLDGIKRDRWVWSGDAYQSLFVNRYLFFDEAVEQRTLIALGGKPPFKCHINTIVDYTFFWFISLYEHYMTYGNQQFLRQIFPQAKEIMAYCISRVEADGFVRGDDRDWVFIDWAEMDKTGALCGEQVLFARALECFAALCTFMGEDGESYRIRAKALQKRIHECFYDHEKHVFVDSYESGKRYVTRHSNILAYLFLPMDDKMKREIYENTILNDEVAQITTPYFKFYENQVHCEAGNQTLLEKSIRDYYGAMLETGATTLYEQFDPTEHGVEHYAMYGEPYGKSLCHAWSASPIYLLGRYRAGVYSTDVGYRTFCVEPQLGDLHTFNCTVPVPGGEVNVKLDQQKLRVLATVSGGTLKYKHQAITLVPGEEIILEA